MTFPPIMDAAPVGDRPWIFQYFYVDRSHILTESAAGLILFGPVRLAGQMAGMDGLATGISKYRHTAPIKKLNTKPIVGL